MRFQEAATAKYNVAKASRQKRLKTGIGRHGGYLRTLRGLVLPVLLLAVWEYLSAHEYISYLLFPAPSRIAETFISLVQSGAWWSNLEISLQRALLGFLLGGGAGLLLGIVVGLFRWVERTMDPAVQMLRMVPHLAVTSLFVLWFGIGETSKVLLIAKGAFFPLYINVFLGLRGVDNKLFEVTRVLEFSRLRQVIQLMLPASLPNLFLGIRMSVAIAWLSLVVAEMMGASSGIGYLMMDARAMSKTPVVFVGIFTFTLIGVLSDWLIRRIERYFLRWKD
ncbi:ABC transporter permease [Paenibacillus senegalimassiliensis]|uniref:ABC transporter permease n=1 Tax=Paenibacillus senegalimassiliensis TaxID=1737426 RepID=UPI00073E64BF|nr:ABC transporter permease [Paenibacillus senegalimassiliensis]